MSRTSDLFYENLKRLEAERSIVRSNFERDINVSTGRFKMYEKRGTLPTGKVIDKIVDYLEIETMELFDDLSLWEE
jgi:hypothetical protein